MVGAAALASQFVSSRVAFAAAPSSTTNTVVGDLPSWRGRRVAHPGAELGRPRLSYLREVRSGLLPTDDKLIALPGANGWALNAALKPVYDTLWNTGELAFVPGVSSVGLSRSHFQAQQYLESGGSTTSTSGWLDRTLATLGGGHDVPRGVGGLVNPRVAAGPRDDAGDGGARRLRVPGWDGSAPRRRPLSSRCTAAMSGSLGEDVPTTLAAPGDRGPGAAVGHRAERRRLRQRRFQQGSQGHRRDAAR